LIASFSVAVAIVPTSERGSRVLPEGGGVAEYATTYLFVGRIAERLRPVGKHEPGGAGRTDLDGLDDLESPLEITNS
jgi:hypothetical protein